MPKKILETTNKLIIPSAWKYGDKAEEIFKSLEAIQDEEIMKAWQEMERYQKEFKISQELRDFRESWKEKIKDVSDENKEKIINSAEQIPVKVEIDSDGSRLVELKLWNKTYKILDPKLENHTDDECKIYYYGINVSKDGVAAKWLWWDDVDRWENQKLKEYVKEKQREWLHIPKIKEMKNLLKKLWKQVGIKDEGTQIAILMYVTGMCWWYWLSMWDNKFINRKKDLLSLLHCNSNKRFFTYYDYSDSKHCANLCMIAIE